MIRGSANWVHKVQALATRPQFYALLALVAFADYFTIMFPIDIFIVLAVFLRPDRWIRICAVMALSSTLGALLIVGLVSWSPHFVQAHLLRGHETLSSVWTHVSHWVRHYGAWTVLISALIPIPQHPALVLATLGRVPIGEISLAFLLGRFIKFFALGYLAAACPEMLMRFSPRLKRKLDHYGYRAHAPSAVHV